MWLAQVGRERIEETLDPELIAERLVATYERKGYTREWINQRLQAISARKELTDRIIGYMKANDLRFDILKQYFPYYPDRLYRNMYEVGLLNGVVI